MNKKSKMTAKMLRGILTTSIFVLVGLSAAGFYIAQEWLSNLSIDISNKVSQSNTVGEDVQSLQRIQAELAQQQDVITKAGLLITPRSDYQGKAIEDLTKYTGLAGIKVLNFGFEDASTQASSSGATARPNGPKSTVIISIESPISYTGLLEFLSLVENNLPKMQVKSLSISRQVEGGDSVRVDKITIGIYTS